MQTTTTRWRVSPLAWVPISAAVAAESVSNALRAYGLGMHLDRFTVHVPVSGAVYPVSIAGAVLVLAAVAVSLSQARAAWVALTPSGPARQRIVAGCTAALLLAISITAMASHILEAQRAKTADEGGLRGRYDRAKKAYDKAQAELGALAGVRTIAEVRAAMDAAPVGRDVFRRTVQCTDVTRQDSFEACRPILDLRQEMGRAIRKAELEKASASEQATLAGLQRPEEARADEAWVSGVWAWIMGLGVVLVATFGTVLFARVDQVRVDVDPDPKGRDSVPAPMADAVPAPVPAQRPALRIVEPARKAEARPVARGLDAADIATLAWVRRFRGEHGRNPQIPELQAAFPGTPKTTAWRRCKAA